MPDKDIEPLRIKMIEGSLRRRLPFQEELAKARNSHIYWWFKCLQASEEYLACCRAEGRGKLSDIYSDFGNVDGIMFPSWWMKQGRKLFAEEEPLQNVRKISDIDVLAKLNLRDDRLIIEVPLRLRKITAIRQINKLLKEAHGDQPIDIWKVSSARRQRIKSKIRMSTVELLLKLNLLRQRHPELKLYELGKRAGVELDLMARTIDFENISDEMEKRRMTIAVSRYLKQAEHLIDNAAKGIFPKIKP
jgi:hypothetical protein